MSRKIYTENPANPGQNKIIKLKTEKIKNNLVPYNPAQTNLIKNDRSLMAYVMFDIKENYLIFIIHNKYLEDIHYQSDPNKFENITRSFEIHSLNIIIIFNNNYRFDYNEKRLRDKGII